MPRSLNPHRYLKRDRTSRNWYWRPPNWLRGQFADVALGKDRISAEDEARRLNRQVDAWLAAGGQQKLSQGRPVRVRPASLASVGEMLAQYRAGAAHAALRGSTRAAARPILRMIEDRFAHEPLTAVTRPVARAWLEGVRERTPGTARQLGLRFRAVWNWAIEEELTALPNPLVKIRSAKGKALIGAGGKRKVLMSWADVQALLEAADRLALAASSRPSPLSGRPAEDRPGDFTRLGHVLLLAVLCIMRSSDALAARRSWFSWTGPLDNGHWRLNYRQSKSMVSGRRGQLEGGREIDTMLPPEVAARLTRWLAETAQDPEAKLYAHGEDHAARLFQQVRAEARATHPAINPAATLRDCRRSGFVIYALNDITVENIVPISGHTIQEGYGILEHYLPRTAAQADRAVGMLRLAG